MDLLRILQKRRSIRKYNDKKISDENLDKILQAGLLSPTGKNIKSWEFIVVRDKKMLELLSECRAGSARMLKEADTAIVVLGDAEKTNVWIEDCSIAMSNMHLMASYLNIGSCWIQARERETENGEKTEDYVRKILKFPENFKLLAILSLGEIDQILPENTINETLLKKIHREVF